MTKHAKTMIIRAKVSSMIHEAGGLRSITLVNLRWEGRPCTMLTSAHEGYSTACHPDASTYISHRNSTGSHSRGPSPVTTKKPLMGWALVRFSTTKGPGWPPGVASRRTTLSCIRPTECTLGGPAGAAEPLRRVTGTNRNADDQKAWSCTSVAVLTDTDPRKTTPTTNIRMRNHVLQSAMDTGHLPKMDQMERSSLVDSSTLRRSRPSA
mmetsp:Transcript_30828/g.82559  ORF Transcript_30828/g.82559 Transcript_30828/m.82559 type:complete len:209 (-) Transcript_30828:1901-2527(-)